MCFCNRAHVSCKSPRSHFIRKKQINCVYCRMVCVYPCESKALWSFSWKIKRPLVCDSFWRVGSLKSSEFEKCAGVVKKKKSFHVQNFHILWHNGLDEYLQWITLNIIFVWVNNFSIAFSSQNQANEVMRKIGSWLVDIREKLCYHFPCFMPLQPLSQGPSGMSWIDCNAKANDGFGCERSLFISSFNPHPWQNSPKSSAEIFMHSKVFEWVYKS